MSLIHPFLLLAGILAAGIPLLIHLWNRRQAKVVNFSSIRFLVSLQSRRVKRLKLKQILILIIRMLIIALIALALARPIITSKWAIAAGGRAESSVVIILDNSYSMSCERLDGNRFDIAKEYALRILKSLRSGDKSSLILMSDFPDVIFKRLTSDIQQVREAVQNAQISHRGSNVWPSISEAYNLLRDSDHPYKAIHLISDLGENGWQNWQDMTDDEEMANIFVVRIGEAEVDNHAIEDITLSNDPVGMGMPVQITAKLVGIDDSSETAVDLFVDGEKKGQATANNNQVSFTHTFENPGTHTGEIHLTSDKLPLDDVRYFAVNVLGQIRVLCAGEYSSYVNLALNPVAPLNPDEEFLILPVECTIEELGTLFLDQYNVIILADVPELPTETAHALSDYVVRGGNLIVFLGEAAKADWYNNSFDPVPEKLEGRMSFPQSPLKLSEWDIDHPIFKAFRDEGASGVLKSPEFYSVFSMKVQPDVKVIASFDKDIPAIMEAEEGSGKVIIFNTAPDTRVSDLPLDPAFLPFMQQTVFYLASRARSSNRNILVGDQYVQAVSEDVEPSPIVTDPMGNNAKAVVTAFRDNEAIHYDPTEYAGIYKLEFKSEGNLRRDYFAANLDTTSESNLKAAEDGEVKGKLGKRATFVSLDAPSVEADLKPDRTGSEMSSRLLMAALLLMLLEIPLANRRRIEEPEITHQGVT